MEIFEENNGALLQLIEEWTHKLNALTEEQITGRTNSQGRCIKQIVGHMVDSASNNIHRVVHLQYGQNPLSFPDYAAHGNNDRWIAIQDYLREDWKNLVQLWKYLNLHFARITSNVDPRMLDNEWLNGDGKSVSLKAMIQDYPKHLGLHLGEIIDLAG